MVSSQMELELSGLVLDWWLETESCTWTYSCSFCRELSQCSDSLDLVKPESTRSASSLTTHANGKMTINMEPPLASLHIPMGSWPPFPHCHEFTPLYLCFLQSRYTCQSAAESHFCIISLLLLLLLLVLRACLSQALGHSLISLGRQYGVPRPSKVL